MKARMNLHDFMAYGLSVPLPERLRPRAMYVSEPGWTSLYVRHTQRILAGQKRDCIDLANLVAKRTGKGLFKALIQRLRTEYPSSAIYIESVLTARFCDGLRRMGFEQDFPEETELPLSFYLLPK